MFALAELLISVLTGEVWGRALTSRTGEDLTAAGQIKLGESMVRKFQLI
jgi:hypothetical protein